MKATFIPIFNRRDSLNKNGKACIEIRLYQNRQRKFVSTGIFITPDQWDAKNQVINRKHSSAEMLNFQIKDLINNYEKAQVAHTLKGTSFSINSIKGKKTDLFEGSFSEFVKEELKNDQLLAPKTKVSHNNTLNKLSEFKEGKDIKFDDLNYSFLDDFLNYLRRKKLAVNTVHKQHKNLKKYIELAIKKGYIDQENPCKALKVKTEQKKRDVLTIEEIQSIETLDLSKCEERIQIVRDLFLFSCYTGLRISDATNLKIEYIKKKKEGYELEFKTIKVGKRAEIPLHSLFKMPMQKLSKPEILLEKYYNEKKEFLFPKLPEPFINRHLKVIAEVAEITVNVSFHTGRHSFGSYMATKIPLPQLMFLMQHSDIKTTMTYVNTSQELVKQGLLKVDWK